MPRPGPPHPACAGLRTRLRTSWLPCCPKYRARRQKIHQLFKEAKYLGGIPPALRNQLHSTGEEIPDPTPASSPERTEEISRQNRHRVSRGLKSGQSGLKTGGPHGPHRFYRQDGSDLRRPLIILTAKARLLRWRGQPAEFTSHEVKRRGSAADLRDREHQPDGPRGKPLRTGHELSAAPRTHG